MLTLALLALLSAEPPVPPRPELPSQLITGVSRDRIQADVETLAGFGTRHSLSRTDSETRGIGAARNWIKTELEAAATAAGGKLQVSFEEFTAPKSQRVPQPHPFVNVVAVLPGTMPEAAQRRYYVVGHYDSMCADVMNPDCDSPGANDDASGTAVTMELARVLAAHPLESTVVFLCTPGEEQGLIGAKYHADQAKTRGAKILGVLNNDIVGDPYGKYNPLAQADLQGDFNMDRLLRRDQGDVNLRDLRTTIRIFSEGVPRSATTEQLAQIRSLAGEYDSPSRQLARYIVGVAAIENTTLKPKLVFRLDRFLRGGDHSMFNDNGFPAVRFTVPIEDYSRQHANVAPKGGRPYGDLPEYCDFGYIADVARLNGLTLIHMANAPSPPARARIITARLGTDTTIRWEKSPEPDVAGYEVVWRDTTSPTWDHAVNAGAATELTLDLGKDDVFFGVRAYDKDGYRSPVVFAGVARE